MFDLPDAKEITYVLSHDQDPDLIAYVLQSKYPDRNITKKTRTFVPDRQFKPDGKPITFNVLVIEKSEHD